MNPYADHLNNFLFRIDYVDVTAVPGVTQKASPSTKAEFDEMINGTGVDEAELQREREKTNRWQFFKKLTVFSRNGQFFKK